MNRRQFLTAASLAAVSLPALAQATAASDRPGARGVVLLPFDLSLTDWPERAHRAKLNTIALHAAVRFDVLRDFLGTRAGEAFLRRCQELDLAVEYELHAMSELLSREWRHKDLSLFRMDAKGERTIDANCCPHSRQALDIIAGKAVEWARVFKPTTHRYFYWPDDGAKWCHCPKCREFSPSDQALMVENHILSALRAHDARATLSHISYSHTLAAPERVKPAPGIFLEFAPIARSYARPISDRDVKTTGGGGPDPATHGGYLDILAANMRIFGGEQTQVLEYWLDVSRFSAWQRPAVRLPWNEKVCRADVAAYRQLGARHFTSFACYIDADYVQRHGDPQAAFDQFGSALNQR